MKTRTRPTNPVLGAAFALAVAAVAGPAMAGPPQAITITTQVVFNPEIYGTFTATGSICATGTVEYVDDVVASGPAAFNVNGLTRFTCDDNSGSFVLRLKAQANARPKDGFDLDGPFSVWGMGTGAYSAMAGHGWFGVVFDWSASPLAGAETYIGFVTL